METLLYDVLSAVPVLVGALGFLLGALVLGFTGAPLWGWALAGALAGWGFGAPVWLLGIYAALVLVFNVRPVRRTLVTAGLMRAMKAGGFLPAISPTEQTAIEAGTVWVERELFSGKPDFERLGEEPYPALGPGEQAFLDGPVETVCRMTDEWDVQERRDLPPAVWEYLKAEGFFGMIIPKAYGGLGFSPLANSAVVQKLATRSLPLSITVMVPNSLGPAELLIHYGTDAQRDYYLPRLARGEEIPCFALTEPGAGSDAGALTSHGLVFRGKDGALYLRLNWEKRYITLAAVATVLGLAFRLYDPDELLGRGTDLGITCALIPAETPGVVLGRRHDPLGIPFVNAPTEGHDVIVPVTAIIGGEAGVGQGWRMLMESLAAGRGISLPAQAAGGAKLVARVAGAHAAVRKQFGLPIGRFEGIEEPLARIGGFAYLMEAARTYTCGALLQGAKPAVASAIMKYHMTELQRRVVNDGMDILGGNGISLGPRNLLAPAYIGLPISITVEGANILTRTLMIFGQGAIRCHPYAYREIKALAAGDLRDFDDAFWRHAGHVVRNLCRAVVLSLTRGHAALVPRRGPATRYYRRLAWASATFAFLADLAMGALGGTLKRREKITGRFADVLSWMYLGAAVLQRFEREGRLREDVPLLHWSMQYALAQMQEGFDGLFRNLDLPGLGWLFRGPVGLWSRMNRLGGLPSDHLGARIAQMLQVPGPHRDRLTAGIFIPDDPEESLGRLEQALRLTCDAEGIERKLKAAVREGRLPRGPLERLAAQATAEGLLTAEEAGRIEAAEAARRDYIQVDAFSADVYLRRSERVAAAGDGGAATPAASRP